MTTLVGCNKDQMKQDLWNRSHRASTGQCWLLGSGRHSPTQPASAREDGLETWAFVF